MGALDLTAHPVVLPPRDEDLPVEEEKSLPLELQKPSFTIWLPQGVGPFMQGWGEVREHTVRDNEAGSKVIQYGFNGQQRWAPPRDSLEYATCVDENVKMRIGREVQF